MYFLIIFLTLFLKYDMKEIKPMFYSNSLYSFIRFPLIIKKKWLFTNKSWSKMRERPTSQFRGLQNWNIKCGIKIYLLPQWPPNYGGHNHDVIESFFPDKMWSEFQKFSQAWNVYIFRDNFVIHFAYSLEKKDSSI